MAQNDLTGKYFAKNTENGTFADLTTTYKGLRILKVDGFNGKGKPINIYTAQWINHQDEDFLITTLDNNNHPVVIRENVDLEITFIVRKKYATFATTQEANAWDCLTTHDNFISFMTDSDIWLKSAYVNNKYVHCVCLKEYKPTTQKLQRGDDSWIMGTITLHTLEAPKYPST